MLIIDGDFINTYNIKLIEGRNFTGVVSKAWMNCKKVIINQKAAAQFGFNKNVPVTSQKILWGNEQYEIAGVVQDYHHLSLRENIQPAIFLPSSAFGYFTIKTDESNMQGKINTLKTLYQQYFPGNPFEYFLPTNFTINSIQPNKN